MPNRSNKEFVQPYGNTFLFAVRLVNTVTKADFTQATVDSITEKVTDTTTGTEATRTLTVSSVVFDTLQTSSLIDSGQYEYNILVNIPSSVIPVQGRKYKYQLEVTPTEGASYVHKTEEITIVAD